MKRALIGIFTCCLIAAGCEKDNPTTTIPNPTPTPNPTTPADTNYVRFTVSGLTDISMGKTEEKILAVGLTHTGGKQEKVTLSTLDLPANVTATFETTSGIPSFATTLKLKTNNATPGTYPIKVKTVTERDSVKTFSLNLTINSSSPQLGCVDDVIGTFSQTYSCNGNNTMNTTIEATGNKDEVKISNLGFYPKSVIAKLNCANKTITIEQQTVEDYVIVGGGTFGDPDKIEINYSVINNQGVYSCSATLTR